MPNTTKQLTSDAPTLSLSEQVAAAVEKIPEDQLRDAVAWTDEYLKQLMKRLTNEHLCAFSTAMDGTCFICGANTQTMAAPPILPNDH
jgi:hypothetical protein